MDALKKIYTLLVEFSPLIQPLTPYFVTANCIVGVLYNAYSFFKKRNKCFKCGVKATLF